MPGAFVRGLICLGLCQCGLVSCAPAQFWVTQTPGPCPCPCNCGPGMGVMPSAIAPQLMYSESAPPLYGSGASPMMPHRPCPPWRPCGPEDSFGGNWWVKQGFGGADYRPACARHDECLASGQHSRYCCDRQFLDDLDAACCNSSNPWLCRLKAREYYLGVRLFGWMY